MGFPHIQMFDKVYLVCAGGPHFSDDMYSLVTHYEVKYQLTVTLPFLVRWLWAMKMNFL